MRVEGRPGSFERKVSELGGAGAARVDHFTPSDGVAGHPAPPAVAGKALVGEEEACGQPFLEGTFPWCMWRHLQGVEAVHADALSSPGPLHGSHVAFIATDWGCMGGTEVYLMQQLRELLTRNCMKVQLLIRSTQSAAQTAEQRVGDSELVYHLFPDRELETALPQTLSALHQGRPLDLSVSYHLGRVGELVTAFAAERGLASSFLYHYAKPSNELNLTLEQIQAAGARRPVEMEILRRLTSVAGVSDASVEALAEMVASSGRGDLSPFDLGALLDVRTFDPSRYDRQASRRRLSQLANVDLEGKLVLLFPHRPDPSKGFKDALRAVKSLVDSGRTDVVLVRIGSDAPPSDEQRAHLGEASSLIAELGLESHVATVPESFDREELASYYAGADGVVSPSYSEAFGMANAEGGMMGLPVFAWRTGGVEKAVQSVAGGLRLLREPGDVRGLSHSLQCLYDLPAEARLAVGATIREGLLSEHSPDEVADRQAKFYRQTIHLARA